MRSLQVAPNLQRSYTKRCLLWNQIHGCSLIEEAKENNGKHQEEGEEGEGEGEH